MPNPLLLFSLSLSGLFAFLVFLCPSILFLPFCRSRGFRPSFVILPPTLVTLSEAKGRRLGHGTIPQTDLSVKHGMIRERRENGFGMGHDWVGLGEGGVRRVIVKVPGRLLRARSRWMAALISPKCVNAWGKFPSCSPVCEISSA